MCVILQTPTYYYRLLINTVYSEQAMSGANKTSEGQFSEFQKAVLSRMVNIDGKRMSLQEATVDSLYLERRREEKEVKMNMRFLSK